ncbi:MAG: hypothetical protein SCARUB_03477 [Candidatus Scalindua rubra]|uniref:Transglutaminase-like domain-containing protein n=1 Tax=Candidatus Scalindua rubra TaxID=1872076 RepID=A0A1E3X6W8_9BACT|nr:MAG: hypothetical protein SCARUB_03477 [Candidatus Scalindua rubra]
MRNNKKYVLVCIVINVFAVTLLFLFCYELHDFSQCVVQNSITMQKMTEKTKEYKYEFDPLYNGTIKASYLVYKPVPDVSQCSNEGNKSSNQVSRLFRQDNILYKRWCIETFKNGKYIYDAYKKIAFNIEFIPEAYKIDFWQTPFETARIKKGDCEDAALLFFSHLPANLKNAEVVWGWALNKKSANGRAHVWYQLIDKNGQRYVVEGFSKDWTGIIPMEIVERNELRKPIITISHNTLSALAYLISNGYKLQSCQSLVDLLESTHFVYLEYDNQIISQGVDKRLHLDCEFVEQLENIQDNKMQEGKKYKKTIIVPELSKEISNILIKLHEVFSRYEKQKKEMQRDRYYHRYTILQRSG